MQYKKKPLTVEALQWTGENHRQMFDFLTWEAWDKKAMTAHGDHFTIDHHSHSGGLIILTKEGPMVAYIGDYIVREPIDRVRGFYPVKEEIFLQTYDPIIEPLTFIDPNVEINTLKEEAKWSDTQIANLKAQYKELSDAATRTEERYLELKKVNETLQQDVDWFIAMVDDPVIKFEFHKRKLPPSKGWGLKAQPEKAFPLPPEPGDDPDLKLAMDDF